MKYLTPSALEAPLISVALSEQQTICSQAPATFYEAVKGDLHQLNFDYVEGNVVRPGTDNNFVYECISAGTSGSSEPGWTTSQDSEFDEGTVRWKAHNNYSLAGVSMSPSDFSITDTESPDASGRQLKIAEKMGIVTHRAGIVVSTALVSLSDQTLRLVTDSQTTVTGDNLVVEGRSTLFFSFNLIVTDPV